MRFHQLLVCALVIQLAAAVSTAQPPGSGGRRRKPDPDRIAKRIMENDQDGDGKVTKDELPERMQRMLGRLDTNKDGAIDKTELDAMIARFRRGGPGTPNAAQNMPQDADRPAAKVEPPQEDVGTDTATHVEVAPLPVEFGELNSLRLRPDGNLLAVDVGEQSIKIIAPSGELLDEFKPGFSLEIIDLAADGSIYCAGDGHVAKLTADGELVKKVKLPEQSESAAPARRGGSRPPGVSGVAVADDAVFVTFGSGWSVSAKARLYRFDRDLENPKLIAEGLRGCCQHCDILYRDGVLYMAENSAFRVVLYGGEGEIIAKWGSKSRDDLQLFGGCCNPMNLAFDGDGVLYTAESGLSRVKRYSPQGEFLGLVGYLGTERFSRGSRFASECCNIPIAVSPDANRVYVADVHDKVIRVLERKAAE